MKTDDARRKSARSCDDLEGRQEGLGFAVQTGHETVGLAGTDHERAEVVRQLRPLPGRLGRDALVAAELVVCLGEALRAGICGRVAHLDPIE